MCSHAKNLCTHEKICVRTQKIVYVRENCIRMHKNVHAREKMYTHAKNRVRTQKKCTRTRKGVCAREKTCTYTKNCVHTQKIVYVCEKMLTQESCEEGGFLAG